MQTVVVGDEITFYVNFTDGLGDPADPDDSEVIFKIVKNATDLLGGPFAYSNAEINKTAVGSYNFSWTTSPFVTPGIYQARWEATIGGDESVIFEQFQIVDPPVESIELTDAPKLYGTMRESPSYRLMGIGLTDRLCLVGHASGLGINNPFQVANMQEAINALGASQDSPLVRALLEAYNVGARDIWLVAAAPETEFVPFDAGSPNARLEAKAEWGGLNFYERYAERLETTYSVLAQYDFPEIIVPVEASFANTGGVDFLTPLVEHCDEAFVNTGAPRLGILGTRIGNITTGDIDTMANDSRPGTYGAAGKFCMIVQGEAVFSLPQMPVSHTSSVAAVAAGTLAASGLDTGLTYKRLKSCVAPYGKRLTKDEIQSLAANRVNALTTTTRGKRGSTYQTILATDNTLSDEGSDYWSIVQMRLVVKIVNQIRAIGNRTLGTIEYMQMKKEISDYMVGLVSSEFIRDFYLSIERDNIDPYKAHVEVSVQPYFGVRELFFQVEVGPGV